MRQEGQCWRRLEYKCDLPGPLAIHTFGDRLLLQTLHVGVKLVLRVIPGPWTARSWLISTVIIILLLVSLLITVTVKVLVLCPPSLDGHPVLGVGQARVRNTVHRGVTVLAET